MKENVLENNINYILWYHLTVWVFRWDDYLKWYQILIDPTVMNSNLVTLILFNKNQAQKNMSLCASFKSKRLPLEGGLENKINHILGSHLIA